MLGKICDYKEKAEDKKKNYNNIKNYFKCYCPNFRRYE